MGSRTVSLKDDTALLREYNALFSDPAVQKVMRYLVVRDELHRRHGANRLPKMADQQFQKDKKFICPVGGKKHVAGCGCY